MAACKGQPAVLQGERRPPWIGREADKRTNLAPLRDSLSATPAAREH